MSYTVAHSSSHLPFPSANARTRRVQELMERSARCSFLIGFLGQFLAIERDAATRALIVRGIRSLDAERAEIIAETRLAEEAPIAPRMVA